MGARDGGRGKRASLSRGASTKEEDQRKRKNDLLCSIFRFFTVRRKCEKIPRKHNQRATLRTLNAI